MLTKTVRPNPEHIDKCGFHLNNRKSNKELNIQFKPLQKNKGKPKLCGKIFEKNIGPIADI